MAESTPLTSTEHPLDLDALKEFTFERVLSENTLTGSMYLLGSLNHLLCILLVQRTLLTSDGMADTVQTGLESFNVFLDNRPYFSAHALLKRAETSPPDLQIRVIWPATEDHIRKHSVQERRMFTETAKVYQDIVLPYINSFSPDRTAWVRAILEGKKEVERVLYRDEDEKNGFVILPDLKWDGVSMNALYLQAIVRDAEIRSFRDLKKRHIGMLREIRAHAIRIAKETYGLEEGKLRLYVHYQPSYYHFHVHIVNIYHENTAGMLVGQAHLLDDIISLLELSPDGPEPSLPARMTLSYVLGTEHKLYPLLLANLDKQEE